jgi:hypothetical protein
LIFLSVLLHLLLLLTYHNLATTMPRQFQTSTLSRERNRIHARKTRQRKKEQMQVLQSKAEDLKEEQICLKQSINEKNTASILVGLLSKETNTSGNNRIEDPIVEELLCRPAEEIPDASKLPELPALILPGQHKSKKCKSSDEVSVTSTSKQQDLPDDGIDYDLLGKDRSKCTASELDQIRRERNRMHAKRTRDRKRLFMEEMAEMCKRLEDENIILQSHLDNLNGFSSSAAAVVAPNNNNNKPQQDRPFVISPSLSATPSEYVPPLQQETTTTTPAVRAPPAPASTILGKQFEKVPVSEHGVTFDQIKTLLEAAGAFSCSGGASASPVSADNSEGESLSDHDHHDDNSCKRRRLNDTEEPAVVVSSSVSVSVPKSITTSSSAGATPVGC